jgi:hypothetical protein
MNTFTLTKESRKNLLTCFERLFGKNTVNYKVVTMMSDVQLCEYWSKNFD